MSDEQESASNRDPEALDVGLAVALKLLNDNNVSLSKRVVGLQEATELMRMADAAVPAANLLYAHFEHGAPLENPGEVQRAFREALGLTRYEYQAIFGVSTSSIFRMEEGRIAPHPTQRILFGLCCDTARCLKLLRYVEHLRATQQFKDACVRAVLHLMA